MNQGKYQDALTWLNLTLKIDQRNALALAMKGITFSILGEEDEGLTLINKALAIEPNNTRILELRKHLVEYM